MRDERPESLEFNIFKAIRLHYILLKIYSLSRLRLEAGGRIARIARDKACKQGCAQAVKKITMELQKRCLDGGRKILLFIRIMK